MRSSKLQSTREGEDTATLEIAGRGTDRDVSGGILLGVPDQIARAADGAAELALQAGMCLFRSCNTSTEKETAKFRHLDECET